MRYLRSFGSKAVRTYEKKSERLNQCMVGHFKTCYICFTLTHDAEWYMYTQSKNAPFTQKMFRNFYIHYRETYIHL